MGRTYAEGLIELGATRRMALAAHLQGNHFPPVPTVWVETCETVIDGIADGSLTYDSAVPCPPGFAVSEMTAGRIAEGLHLEPWIEDACY
jgi:hypothetical protein